MLDLQLQIEGRPATLEERTQFIERYNLNTYAQWLVGVAEGQDVPSDEDINTPEHFVHEEEEPVDKATNDGDEDLGEKEDD